jgi:hypothetical protein
MVNFSCTVCGCCTRTDIVREHLEDTSVQWVYSINKFWFPPVVTLEQKGMTLTGPLEETV